ncbi:MAG: hypothetical protein B6243_01760 [Anaerolineaceae bacterium 4572_5.2]|nr:MAG: hypothetical protein B6243_01760 [Anaerolineaceae bacterium 4572_5.2]
MKTRVIDVVEVRVFVDRDKDGEIYEQLVSQASKNAEDYPFATKKDLFMVAACLGAKHNRFEELAPKNRKEVFRGSTFDNKTDVPVLAALAYQKEKDVKILSDPKKIVEIAQGWANGGIHMVRDELLGQPGRPLYNLVNMLLD